MTAASISRDGFLPLARAHAELGVIGGIMLDPRQALPVAMELGLAPEDFLDYALGQTFAVALELWGEGKPIDTVLLIERAHRRARGVSKDPAHEARPLLMRAIDASIQAAMSSIATAANIRYYVEIMRDHARLAALQGKAKALGVKAYETPDEAIIDAEALLRSASDYETPRARPVSTALECAYDAMTKRAEGTGPPLLDVGIRALDEKIGGLAPGDLWVFGGRPSMGKTALGVTVAMNVAWHSHRTGKDEWALFFSLEMSEEKLAQRILSFRTGIPTIRMRRGDIVPNDWGPLLSAVKQEHETPLLIIDRPSIKMHEIAGIAERIALTRKLAVVVVDYLQLVRTSGKFERREQEVSFIGRSLKALAKTLGCPVIALAQLNRELAKRGNHMPMLSDLRESGSIEQDSDGVIFVHREYLFDTRTPPTEAILLIAKQRDGEIGPVTVHFDPITTSFRDEDRP